MPSPVSYHLPQSTWSHILAGPSKFWFTVLGVHGLAVYHRQIVRVFPSNPGLLALGPNKSRSRIHDEDEVNGWEGVDRDRREMSLKEWVGENVPSLRRMFIPAWWLPKQSSAFGDFTKVDAVVVNFRGCAGVPVTSPQPYSAATTVDLVTCLHYLRHHFPLSPLHGMGFSLGASLMARYIAETSSQSLVSSGIVLGCPRDVPGMS